jgi:hypothetical protein
MYVPQHQLPIEGIWLTLVGSMAMGYRVVTIDARKVPRPKTSYCLIVNFLSIMRIDRVTRNRYYWHMNLSLLALD